MGLRSIHPKDIRAILLAGGSDFGRSVLAGRLPRALWPIAGESVLGRLIDRLYEQGVRSFVICCGANRNVIEENLSLLHHADVIYLDEALPRGTAGCVLDAAKGGDEKMLLVLNVPMVLPPDLAFVMDSFREVDADMTMMFSPAGEKFRQGGHVGQVYLCCRSVLDYIPQEGYCDIKEGLIPKLIQADKVVKAVELSSGVGNFRSRREYLESVSDLVEKVELGHFQLGGFKRIGSKRAWVSGDVSIGVNVKLIGPLLICDGAQVAENAVIFGPSVIGKGVSVGKDSMISASVLWDDCRIGQGCEIRGCVVDSGVTVNPYRVIEDQSVVKQCNQLSWMSEGIIAKADIVSFFDEAGNVFSGFLDTHKKRRRALNLFAIFVAAVVLLWSYMPEITDLWRIWKRSDEYSSGLLVPFLAGYILWVRRDRLRGCMGYGSLWGVAGLVFAQVVRIFGLFFMYGSAQRLSMIISVGSILLLLFGWRAFRGLLTVVLFLCLMMPVPRMIHSMISLPMQNMATSSAVFGLELMGFFVIRDGNVIYLNGVSVAVAEACNGLRMVTAFFVITGFVVMLMDRTLWEKMIVMASSLPIALFCNSIRLTVTAIFFTMVDAQRWENVFHDFGGYAMMPVALLLIVFEFWLLGKMMITPEIKSDRLVEI